MLLFVLIAVVPSISLLAYFWLRGNQTASLKGKHVLITGGSKGIGKCVAEECAKLGAKVTIIARNERELNSAKEDIALSAGKETEVIVHCFTADICRDYETIEKVIREAESLSGPVDILFNCAGNAVSHRFDETPIKEFKRMMDVNYMGAVYCTKAVLPAMKARREGRIVFFSSVAGLVGIYGFSAYSASKFALIGFAQALQMEVKPYSIGVTVSLPPDTDTPGFAKEQETKPEETKAICEGAGLWDARVVAKQTLADVINAKFASTVGVESFAVKTACSGMFPIDSCGQLLFQIVSMGFFRLIASYFLFNCHRIVAKYSKCKSD